jgi:predicted dehydrogenase
MSEFSRREFLYDSLLAAAAAATAGSAASAFAAASAEKTTKSANDKLGVLVIGVHDRGTAHLGGFEGKDDTEVVAICDVDSDVGQKRCEETAGKQGGHKPVFYQDIRKALEDKSVDIVSIATPNHWHALATIWAIQHGKDVYVEKPVCHNIWEGQQMVEAARKHNKIVQTGTQCRSNAANIRMVEFIKSGKIGEVNLARGLCYKGRPSIGAKGEYDVPSVIDYDIWTGPAPFHPKSRYNSGLATAKVKDPAHTVHYSWHWLWDYGNGDLGNQGIHQMDVARWGLGVDSLANGVISYGGRFGYEDAGEVANTQIVILDYGPKTLVFEVRGLKTDALKGAHVGNIYEGTDGYVVMTGYSDGAAFDKSGKLIETFKGGGNHFGNFVKAVRSRKKEDLNADIQEGFLSSALCHMGNISYRLGQQTSKGQILERLKDVKMADNAQETLDRTIEHLASNKVKIDGDAKLQCGQFLKFDPKQCKFADAKANDMLSREYRAPFVVPSAGQV